MKRSTKDIAIIHSLCHDRWFVGLNTLQRKAKYKHWKISASATSGNKGMDFDAKMACVFDAVWGPQTIQAPGICY